jgi:hypothetical protein
VKSVIAGLLLFATGAQAQVAKITISPKTATIEVGKTRQLSRVVTVVWASSDTTIATVSQVGLVTGRKPGVVQITVSAGPTLIATSTVTIIPAAVASVQVILGKSQLASARKRRLPRSCGTLPATSSPTGRSRGVAAIPAWRR